VLRAGDSIDRYVIEAVIGEGGMGRVYRALDPRLGRRVAIKLLLPDGSEKRRAQAAERMQREARAAAAFSHPNVIAIHDVGEHEGSPYIAMEFVSGRTLRDLAHDAAASDAKKLAWLLDIARGLAAAHRAGLVHRDIKPDNVMVTQDGIVKILDFGIARRADAEGSEVDVDAATGVAHLPSLTAEGHIVGTPQYMAPEQLRGEPLDRRCDQFAWGVMAWELLAGASPWGAPTNPAMLITAVLSSEPRSLHEARPAVSGVVSDAVARAMSKRRDSRFGAMDELVAAIEGKAAEAPAVPPSQEEPAFTAPTLTTDAVVSPPRNVATPEATAPTVAVAATQLSSPGAAVTMPAVRPGRLATAETLGWLAAGLLWTFAFGYAGDMRGLDIFLEGGFVVWAMPAVYAVAGVHLLRGSPVRWLPVLLGLVGTFATYVGLQTVLHGLGNAGVSAQVFRILHRGLFEANIGRFVGFALAAVLVVASLRLLPRATSREQLMRRAVAAAFAYGCMAVSVLTRLGAVTDYAWASKDLHRSERVGILVAAARTSHLTSLALALGALVLALLVVARARSLPGALTLRGIASGQAAVALVVVLGVAADEASAIRFQAGIQDLYAAMAPEVELFASLDPPSTSGDLPAPPVAPTLKLARDRVAIDAKPVGLVSALDQGNLDAILLADLSHRLGELSSSVEPRVLVMADRATTVKTLVAGLRVVLRAGVSHVGLLYTRGAPPVFHEGDPAEAAYAVPQDFGMAVVALSYCPVALPDWTALAQDATVCVGSAPDGSPDTRPLPTAVRDADGPGANLYFCKDTLRPLVAPRPEEVCTGGSIAWCATDGTQVACCAPGLVARHRDGTCECPPGGVVGDGPPSSCPRSSEPHYEEKIRATVRANFDPIRRCFLDALQRAPGQRGRLSTRFEIGPDGQVFYARIKDTTLTDPASQTCVVAEFRKLQFPPPPGGASSVVYPILFSPDGD